MVQITKLEGIKEFQKKGAKDVSLGMLSLEQELVKDRPASSWNRRITAHSVWR